MPKLRVGLLDGCLSRPLTWGFIKGHHTDLFAPGIHPPARICTLLAQGNLDVALLPAIDIVSIPGLRVLPDLCMAVLSGGALLVHRGPLSELAQVGVDPDDRQATALLQLVLGELAVTPEIVPSRRSPQAQLEYHGATLLGGDRALEPGRGAASAADVEVLDLAAEWRRQTGLPCIFGLWAVRDGVELPDLAFYFKSSLRYGLSLRDNLARETAAELGIDPATVLSALDDCRYFLQPNELETIEVFHARARASGLLASEHPVRLWPE